MTIEDHPQFGYTEHTITLRVRQEDDSHRVYVWMRGDGKPVSPVFNTAEAALYFSERVPFLTDEEWTERGYQGGSVRSKTVFHVANKVTA